MINDFESLQCIGVSKAVYGKRIKAKHKNTEMASKKADTLEKTVLYVKKFYGCGGSLKLVEANRSEKLSLEGWSAVSSRLKS